MPEQHRLDTVGLISAVAAILGVIGNVMFISYWGGTLRADVNACAAQNTMILESVKSVNAILMNHEGRISAIEGGKSPSIK